MTKPASELIALADRISGHLGPFNFITRAERELVVTTLRTAANQSGSERAGSMAGWTDNKLAAWARNWHWQDTADDKPVDPSIYFRDMRMLKAFVTALATPPAQPAPSKCEDCSGSGLALNSAGEPDICKACGGNTVVPSEASTHGKPDGAVRSQHDKLHLFLSILDRAGGETSGNDDKWNWINYFCDDAEPLDTFNRASKRGLTHVTHDVDNDNSVVYLTDAGRAFVAALSPKIAAAETSPGDAGRTAPITCPNCYDESDCSNVDICNAVEAAYSSDVKVEAKSQEPDAVAIKLLEWSDHDGDGVQVADAVTGEYRVRCHGGEFWVVARDGIPLSNRPYELASFAKAAAQANHEQRIRAALIHPTTKPEALAVSVDALTRAIEDNIEVTFIIGEDARVDSTKAVAAIAALIAGGR